jgi:hypothetical protein
MKSPAFKAIAFQLIGTNVSWSTDLIEQRANGSLSHIKFGQNRILNLAVRMTVMVARIVV